MGPEARRHGVGATSVEWLVGRPADHHSGLRVGSKKWALVLWELVEWVEACVDISELGVVRL